MDGKRLRQLREEKKLKQEELANILSISASAIGMYERNLREPDDELKLKISKYFNCSIDYLIGKTDIRNYEEIKADVDLTGLDTEDIEKIQEYADLIKFRKNLNEKSS